MGNFIFGFKDDGWIQGRLHLADITSSYKQAVQLSGYEDEAGKMDNNEKNVTQPIAHKQKDCPQTLRIHDNDLDLGECPTQNSISAIAAVDYALSDIKLTCGLVIFNKGSPTLRLSFVNGFYTFRFADVFFRMRRSHHSVAPIIWNGHRWTSFPA